MDTVLIGIVLAAILLLAAAALFFYQSRRRTEQLRTRFGLEYESAVSRAGRSAGERELRTREQRVAGFDIRELEPEQRRHYSERWKTIQVDFVDSPGTAILAADALVQEVMASRGYPVADFDQRAADLSVRHADFVMDYRLAHAISEAQRDKPRATEELRQAIIYYRALFADLLGEPVSARTTDALVR